MSRPETTILPDAAVPGRAPRRPAGKRLAIGVVAALILGGIGWQGYGYVTDGRFQIETDDAYVQADIVEVAARVDGYVTAVDVAENQRVGAGDVILRIDDGDYRIALETARESLALLDRTLARIDAQAGAAAAAVDQARAGQAAAQAALENALLTERRIAGLALRRVAPAADRDDAEAALKTARANLASAAAGVAAAEANVAVLDAERAETEAGRRSLELKVAQAERDLSFTVLRAAADGVVTNLGAEPGDLVSAGTRLAALVPDRLYVEANFKETQLRGIRPGAPVRVAFDAVEGETFRGRVSSIAPATGATFSLLPAENATGNFTKVVQRVPVRIELPAEALASGALRAGLSVVVEVDRRAAGG